MTDPDYQSRLLGEAQKKYPFIAKYNPVVTVGQGDGYAETWPVNEEGDKSYPRPKDIPVDRVGVQVFRPDNFGPDDLAAEFLHVDPRANDTRYNLLNTLTLEQKEQLKRSSKDYEYTLKRGEGEQRAIQNALDSALRGYTTGQWPAEANAAMRYTPDQLGFLDSLRNYMTTGEQPGPTVSGVQSLFSR